MEWGNKREESGRRGSSYAYTKVAAKTVPYQQYQTFFKRIKQRIEGLFWVTQKGSNFEEENKEKRKVVLNWERDLLCGVKQSNCHQCHGCGCSSWGWRPLQETKALFLHLPCHNKELVPCSLARARAHTHTNLVQSNSIPPKPTAQSHKRERKRKDRKREREI